MTRSTAKWLKVDGDAIPAELKRRTHHKQWVCWRALPSKTGAKPRKVPYNPVGRRNAQTDNPKSWNYWEDCWRSYLNRCPYYTGVGFVFRADDPYAGIDLDRCRDPETGEIHPAAQAILDSVKSYAEVSPSGGGVKIIVKGKLPANDDLCHKAALDGIEVEVYDRLRYFALTGHIVNDTHREIIDAQDALDCIVARIQLGHEAKAPSSSTQERLVISSDGAFCRALRWAIGIEAGHENDGSRRLLKVCGIAVKMDLCEADTIRLVGEVHRLAPFPEEFSGADILRRLRDAERKNERGKCLGQSSQTPAAEPAPVLTCLADVEPRAVSWLWPGRIPLGRITLLVGRPGEGKSFVTIDAAARVTTGTPWPDGSSCPQGSVILISAEDDPADTIRPRLDAHYADARRVHLLSAVRRGDGEGQYERMITLSDLVAIEAALVKLPDCKLIVVDPIGSFLGGGTDAHRDNEVRGVLAPIAMLAEKYGPAVLVVAHRRKSAGSIADDLALGSRAFTGIARAVWHLTRDNEQKARRLLLPGKNHLAREGDGLAFSIIGEPARISWEREPVAMSADDALAAESQAREQKPGPDAEAHDAAVAWLRAALAGGPRLTTELLDEWKNGQGGSERTLKRAKHSLGVEADRVEVPGPWSWRWPGKDAKLPEGDQLGPLGILAETAGNLPGFDADNSKGAKLPEPGILGGERVRVTL